jgi:hypothetical protein
MSARKRNWGTARNIELYGLAYGIAWKQISTQRKREQPDISLQLHASIRQQLKKGATDPLVIAVEAFKALDEETNAEAPRELNRCRWLSSPRIVASGNFDDQLL